MRKIFLTYISICIAVVSLHSQVTFTAQSQTVDCAAGTICVDVDVTNFIEITGMQYALFWDTSQFDYNNHQFFLDTSPTDVVDTDKGYMGFSYFANFGGYTVPDNTTIITLCLDIKGNAGTSSMIRFDEQPGQIIEVSDRTRGPLMIGTEVIFTDATITIADIQDPQISCPADVTSSTSVVNGIAPATLSDNCGVESVSYTLGGVSSGSGMNDASGMSFPNGLTTISYLATDYAGNTDACSFNLTVNDTTLNDKLIFDPQATLDCNTGRVTIDVHVFNFDSLTSMQFGVFWDTLVIEFVSHTNQNLPSATFITSVADEGRLAMFWTQTPPDPDGYSLPDNTIIFSLEYDAVGSLSIPLITFDTIPPLDVEISDVNGRLDASEFEFRDGSLNILDVTPPVFSGCPLDATISASVVSCGSPYVWTAPTVTDDCDVSPVVTSTHNPGDFFSVGVDTVIYIATDHAGNMDTCQFIVTVVDDTNPSLSCPANVNVNPDAGMCTAVVNGINATASDNCIFSVAYVLAGATTGSGNNDASGTAFNPGTTTVTYTVTDNSGNTNSCSFTVIVADNTAPVLTCPASVTVSTDAGVCNAVVNGIAPVASDDCPFTLTYTLNGATSGSGSNDASGTTFNPGITNITYTATDASGNSNSCSFSVTVNDTEGPMLSCPADISVSTDAGMCSASVTVPPAMVTENCGAVTVVNDFNGTNNASGTYPPGSTTVIWTATDASGNAVSCSMTVTVTDDILPTLNCPSDLSVDITSGSSTVVNNIDPVSSDGCGIASTTYMLANATTGSGSGSASGQTFNVGTTTVTYTVTDNSGNSISCNFNVTVRFVTSDIITCPSDRSGFTDAASCGNVVNNIAPIILIDPGDVASITFLLSGASSATGNNDASGSIFNKGATIVRYFAEDIFGNRDTCQFTVVITDNVAPTIANCPASITLQVGNNCDTTASWTPPTGSDNCMLASLTSSHSSGSTFSLGSTVVTYTATDDSGNTATCSFTVTVEDDNAPVFANCPVDITVDAPSGACQAVASWTPPTANDECVVTLSSSHNPGDMFMVGGSTTITYTASDQSGNSASCTFTVTVRDVTPPNIGSCQLDNLQIDYLNDCRAIVSWDPITATDACSVVTVSCSSNPGDTLNVGVTQVICIAVDAAGNTARCTLTIEVEDNMAPVLTSCPEDVTVNTDAGECNAMVLWTPPTATDNCGFVDLSASQGPGTTFNSGTTVVTYTATDASGNSINCTFNVTVVDMEAPEMDCDSVVVNVNGTIISDPNNILTTVTADNTCQGVKLDFNAPMAQDNCDGAFAATQTDNSGFGPGSTFPGGTTTLEYTATDQAGNSVSCELHFVIIPLDPIAVSILPGTEICAGEEITLLAGNVPPGGTIVWSGPGGYTSDQSSPTISNVPASGSGVYTATVTLTNGCQTTGNQQLTVLPSPVFAAGSNSPVCGGALRLMANIDPSSPAVTDWLWQFPNQLTDDTQNPVVPNPDNTYAGTYVVTAMALNGCSSSETINVQVTNIPAPDLQTDCDETICLGDACLLMGTEYVPRPDTYNWMASPSTGAGMPANTDNNELQIRPTEPGIYVYNYWVTTEGCDSDTATLVLNVADSPEAVDDAYNTPYETDLLNFNFLDNDNFSNILGVTLTIPTTTANGTLTDNGDGTYSYTPRRGFIGTDQFLYQICYNCGSEPRCATAIVTINVVFEGDECEVPNVISPNNDGINDELFINCIEALGVNSSSIQIFNQWGDEVYKAAPYNNDWMGTYEDGDLPDGTYYFIFKVDANAAPLNGYVTIFR